MEQLSAQGFGHQAEKPTQILSDEHRIIERVLDAVQRLTLAPARQNLPRLAKGARLHPPLCRSVPPLQGRAGAVSGAGGAWDTDARAVRSA